MPRDLDLAPLLDNYATRKTPEVKTWLLKHPRFPSMSLYVYVRVLEPAGYLTIKTQNTSRTGLGWRLAAWDYKSS